MRHATFFFVLILFFSGCASTASMPEEMREVQQVEQHEQTQDEAFSRLRQWVAESYPNDDKTLQLEDEDEGTIVLESVVFSSLFPGAEKYPYSYTMTMDVRDERVRFTQRITEGRYNVTRGVAENMHQHFMEVRTAALSAIEEVDDF